MGARQPTRSDPRACSAPSSPSRGENGGRRGNAVIGYLTGWPLKKARAEDGWDVVQYPSIRLGRPGLTWRP